MKSFSKKKHSRKIQLKKSLDLVKHYTVDGMFNEFVQNKFVEIVAKNAPYKTLSKREKIEEKTMDH